MEIVIAPIRSHAAISHKRVMDNGWLVYSWANVNGFVKGWTFVEVHTF